MYYLMTDLTVSASLNRFAFKASAIYDWLQRQHLPARCGGDSGSPPSLLQLTEDQLTGMAFTSDASGPFVNFSPQLSHDDYLWGLEDGEGVSDLFDTYDLGDLLKTWGIQVTDVWLMLREFNCN